MRKYELDGKRAKIALLGFEAEEFVDKSGLRYRITPDRVGRDLRLGQSRQRTASSTSRILIKVETGEC